MMSLIMRWTKIGITLETPLFPLLKKDGIKHGQEFLIHQILLRLKINPMKFFLKKNSII